MGEEKGSQRTFKRGKHYKDPLVTVTTMTTMTNVASSSLLWHFSPSCRVYLD
jgi:hypothetical protein